MFTIFFCWPLQNSSYSMNGGKSTENNLLFLTFENHLNIYYLKSFMWCKYEPKYITLVCIYFWFQPYSWWAKILAWHASFHAGHFLHNALLEFWWDTHFARRFSSFWFYTIHFTFPTPQWFSCQPTHFKLWWSEFKVWFFKSIQHLNTL